MLIGQDAERGYQDLRISGREGNQVKVELLTWEELDFKAKVKKAN